MPCSMIVDRDIAGVSCEMTATTCANRCYHYA